MKRTILYVPLIAGWLISAQQGPEPGEIRATTSAYRPRTHYTISIDTKIVEVGVVVRDQRGHTVPNLTRDDFEITDEGRKRDVKTFSVETSAPPAAPAAPGAAPSTAAPTAPPKVSQRYVGLLFDDYSMGPGELPRAQAAARRYVKEGIRPGDHIGIFTVSGTQNLAFTADAVQLTAAIDRLHLNSRTPSSGGCPGMPPYDAYLIANRIDVGAFNAKLAEAANCQNLATPAEVTDFEGRTSPGRSRASAPPPSKMLVRQVIAQANATWEQVRYLSQITLGSIQDVVDYMAQMPESRMILMASSGFISGTLENELDDITRRATHAGVVINSLDAKGLFADEPLQNAQGMDARSVTRLQLVGTAPKDVANDSLATLAYNTGGLFFHNNNDLAAGFYELGMRPDVSYVLGFSPDDSPDGKYHKLKVRLKNPGHDTVQARLGYMAVDRPPEPVRRIDTAAAEDSVLKEVAGSLSSQIVQSDSGDHGVKAIFHVDVQKLPFKVLAGVRQQQISLVAVLTDPNGAYVAGKQSLVDLALKDPTFQTLSAAGLNLTLVLPVPPGSYKLRAAIYESVEGKISASTLPVEVR